MSSLITPGGEDRADPSDDNEGQPQSGAAAGPTHVGGALVLDMGNVEPADPAVEMMAGSSEPQTLLGLAVETALVVGLRGLKGTGRLTGELLQRTAGLFPAGLVDDVASATRRALAREGPIDWDRAGRRAERQLARIVAVIVPVVTENIDPAKVIERIDVNAVLDQVDVNALLEQVDVEDLARRVRVGNILAESTGRVAESALDLARRQGVGLDTVLGRAFDRILGRDPDRMPAGPPELIEEEPP